MRPRCSTATRSAIVRTSARSCVTNRIASRSDSWSSVEQPHDRRLHRDVERRGDLVADQDLGSRRQSPCDRDALALAARELARIAPRGRRPAARRARAARRPALRPRAPRRPKKCSTGVRTISPIVRRGLSELVGLWKTYWTTRQSSFERSRAVAGERRAREPDRHPRAARAGRRSRGPASSCPSPTRPRAPGTRARAAAARRRAAPGASRGTRSRPATSSSGAAAVAAGRAGRLPSTGGASSATRMQRATWPGPTVTGGGGAAVQASIACSQRGAKTQPTGRAPGAGTRPGIAVSSRAGRDVGNRADELARVRVRGALEERVRRPVLDDPAGVHHEHAVGQAGDGREVVADVDGRRVVAAAERAHRREHVGLRRHVEARRRLVEHDQRRVAAGTRSRGTRAAAGRPRAGAGSAAAARGRPAGVPRRAPRRCARPPARARRARA